MCEPRALRRSGSPGLVRSRTRRGNTLRSGVPLTATGSEDGFIKAGEPTGVAAPPTRHGGCPSQGFLVRGPRSSENKLERATPRASHVTNFPLGGNKLERGEVIDADATLFPPAEPRANPRACDVVPASRTPSPPRPTPSPTQPDPSPNAPHPCGKLFARALLDRSVDRSPHPRRLWRCAAEELGS